MSTFKKIISNIETEKAYADKKWGSVFDAANTANDWNTYVMIYLARATVMPWDGPRYRENMIKAAGLCISAIEQYDADKMAKRHYD